MEFEATYCPICGRLLRNERHLHPEAPTVVMGKKVRPREYVVDDSTTEIRYDTVMDYSGQDIAHQTLAPTDLDCDTPECGGRADWLITTERQQGGQACKFHLSEVLDTLAATTVRMERQ